MKVLVILTLFSVALGDLPVHCVKHQIKGRWTLELTQPLVKGSGPLSCGHQTPSNERTSQSAAIKNYKVHQQMEVILTAKNNVVRNKHLVGKWTMVYDEGFEVDIKEFKCFAFSKYVTNYSGAYSYCGETLLGWYENTETGERGCYKATKLNDQHEVSEGAQNGHVVQPEFFQRTEMIQQNKVWNRKDSEQFVKQINQANLKWTAKVYENLVGLTTMELNQKAGRKRHYQVNLIEQKKHQKKAIHQSDLSHLPKQFSWEKHLGKMYEQQQCGSCYAISTMSMLSARLRIQGIDVDLSPQYSVDCNYYNQGCEGGYPFLVEKFSSESGVMEEKDRPYIGRERECDKKHGDLKYKVSNYRFVGGAYGKSTEQNIMEEIHKNGPIVMNFEPTFDFMFYVGGVYHTTIPDWIVNGLARPEWEKVDHSVLCYGWGETKDGEKYWLLQNSWGKAWGEGGRFRMRRGTDESAIESMAEAADIEIVK